jgi:outer membrane receptor for ferrienterochelin and colicins
VTRNTHTALPAALLLASALAQAQAPAPAAPPAPPPEPAAETAPQRVEITGGRESDTEQRRQSTAAKIIIGREEIEKFGDSSVGEVLRRLPGVTTPGAPGRGGPPRMRGLGSGYTQLLIDGQRMPPGFSLESLTPEQIERIEILRAPTAETGARAIAGTINIITREGFRRRLNELRAGVGIENGESTPGGNWTHNDSAGPLTYNLSASAFLNRRRSESSTETVETALADGSVLEAQHEDTQTREQRRGLNLTTRLQWRLSDSGDMLMLSPSVFHSESHSDRRFQLGQAVPAAQALPLYDLGDTVGDNRFTNARLNGQWRQALASGLRLELNGAAGAWRAVNDSLRNEYRDGGTLLRTLQDSSRSRETSANLTVKLSQSLGGNPRDPDSAHSLVGGLEAETVRRTETRSGDSQADDGTGNLQASSLRIASYVQDEWRLTPNWALNAGLRWEGITTRGTAANGDRPSNRSSVATPLLHLLWKPDPKGRDQVRLSLTRSYRSPGLGTLISGITLNSQSDPSGPNDPTRPDRGGNPNLLPELATGVDLALERFLGGGGLLSANVFHRSISNLLRTVTALETVDYSPAPRYVARQQNVGDAVTEGVELEAKFPLDSAVAGAPKVELRANLSLFRSRVAGVPGPDNRLDQQAKATANVGADYRFRSPPLKALTVGGNLNWVPGVATQLSDSQRTTSGDKRVFDAFALWTFDPTVALRLLASNLGARDYESSNTIATAASSETARSVAPSYTNWQLRLELKL